MSRRIAVVALAAAVVGSLVGAGVASVAPGGPAVPSDPEDPDEPSDTEPGEPADLARFESPEAFAEYFAAAERGGGWIGLGRPQVRTVAAEGDGGDAGGPSVTLTGGAEDGRLSSTNVQEAGIDEPDVLKTDPEGRVAFYAGPGPRRGPVAGEYGGATTVIDVSEPFSPAVVGAIEAEGRMLLSDDSLVVLAGDAVYGYDVSDPSDPTREWTRAPNGSVTAARLVNGTVYLVVQRGGAQPCPVRPLVDGPSVACTEVHHPTAPVTGPATYTTVALDPADGAVEGTASVVASAGRAVTYVSPEAVYLTYTRQDSRTDLLVEFVLERSALDRTARERLREVRSYDLSPAAYRAEVRATVQAYVQRAATPEPARQRLEETFGAYLAEHRRELVTTGVVRVGIGADGPTVEAHGEVPGRPLNQFSMDARDGRLRIATTVPGAGDAESVNDVYVLDRDLEIEGSAQGMGEGQRVYAARFVGDTAYLVTFRQVDPFHVVDLSDPANPRELGEVKLPGFSEYLHPIGENRVLGVGREDGRVKAVVFDVSEPSNPTVVDSELLEDRWSAVSQSHHAFLQDPKHDVAFVPGSGGGHVFAYDNEASGEAALSLQKRVDVGGPAVRALYVEDALYVFGHDEVGVVDERTWERVGTLDLVDGDWEGGED